MTLMGRWLWEQRKNRFLGFLFGAAIGEALATPETRLPEMEMLLQGNDASSRQIELYLLNNRVLGTWSVPTIQFLAGCRAVIVMKENSSDGRKFFDRDFLETRYLEAENKLWTELPEDFRIQQRPLSRGPGMTCLRVVPLIFLSRYSRMRLHQTITMALRAASLTCHRPVDIFPVVELILLLNSEWSEVAVTDVYEELRTFMKRSRFRQQYHFDEYEKWRLRPLRDLEKDSELWLWKNIIETLELFPGRKWDDIPKFLPGLLKVKSEAPFPEVAGTLAGAVLGLSLSYDSIPVDLIENLRHAQIIDDVGKQCLDEVVHGGMSIGPFRYRPKKKKRIKQLAWVEPVSLMYQSDEKVRCPFISIIVKNEALKAKYPGGVKAYAQQFHARLNDWITVTCSMGEIEDNMRALKDHGISVDDYVVVDFATYEIDMAMSKLLPDPLPASNPNDIDLGVKWLKVSYADGFYVSYVDVGNE